MVIMQAFRKYWKKTYSLFCAEVFDELNPWTIEATLPNAFFWRTNFGLLDWRRSRSSLIFETLTLGISVILTSVIMGLAAIFDFVLVTGILFVVFLLQF